MRPKLVATDVDGTLLRSDDTVSARTRVAIAALHQASIPLVLVTGRSPRWMPPVFANTGFLGPFAVCCNGALIYSSLAGRVVASRMLDPPSIKEIVSRVRRILPGAGFAVEYGERFVHEPAYKPRWDIGLPSVSIVDMDSLTSTAAAKLLVRHPSLTIEDLVEIGTNATAGIAMVTHGTRDVRIEISAPGVDKASGLALVAAELGVVAGSVASFGDMPNDLAMLEWSGRSYAVANAHPEVIRRVSEVVPANDDDGVARTIERWMRSENGAIH